MGGARLLVDGAQLVPHQPVNMRGSGADDGLDFLVFSAHKLYAPYGAGVLVAPRSAFHGLPDELGGGIVDLVTLANVVWTEVPGREEAGSPNVIGAVALGVAIETLLELDFDEMLRYEVGLGGRLLTGLSRIPGVTVLGGAETPPDAPRLGLASFVIDGVHHGLAAAALSHEWGIAVRNGCFCANPYVFHLLHMSKAAVDSVEGEVNAGHRKALPGAVRASLAPYNDEAEVDRFVEAVGHIARGDLQGGYEQAADGTFSPPGGWPKIASPLRSLVQPLP